MNELTATGRAQVYEAALKADAEFQAALIDDYGERASEMRYAQVLPTRLFLLRAAKLEADEAWLKVLRQEWK